MKEEGGNGLGGGRRGGFRRLRKNVREEGRILGGVVLIWDTGRTKSRAGDCN